MVTPIAWNEFETFDNGDVTLCDAERRLSWRGDAFAKEVAAIGAQRLPKDVTAAALVRVAAMFFPEPELPMRGHIVSAAIEILADGKPRTADELLAEALKRGLVPKNTTHRYIYTALIEYIARTKGHDRKPLIVQDPDHRFRVNHSADDWPAPKMKPAPRAAIAEAPNSITRLRTASTGDDPQAFELAVCDVFGALGFVATHVGGGVPPTGTSTPRSARSVTASCSGVRRPAAS